MALLHLIFRSELHSLLEIIYSVEQKEQKDLQPLIPAV